MSKNYTTYKGFAIFVDNGRFEVPECGKAGGYPTLNHAKGAITNYIKARDAKHDAGMEVLAAKWAGQDANGTRFDMVAHVLSKPPVRHLSRNKREGYFDGKCNGSYGQRTSAKLSRLCSVRCIATRPANRKQRKQAKLYNFRDSAAQ